MSVFFILRFFKKIYPFLKMSYKNWMFKKLEDTFHIKKLDIFTKEINVDKFQIFDPPPRKKVFS